MMSEVRVAKLDLESQEAVIEITIPYRIDNKADYEDCVIKAFCHPFHFPLCDYSISLFGFGVGNVWIEHSLQKPQKIPDGFFSYRISAKVVDASKQHVKLGEFDLFLDKPLPKDICNGEIVSFDVLRIDVELQ